jgi:hypothetical protein
MCNQLGSFSLLKIHEDAEFEESLRESLHVSVISNLQEVNIATRNFENNGHMFRDGRVGSEAGKICTKLS